MPSSCFHTFIRYEDEADWLCRYCGEPEPKLEGMA